MIRNIDIKAAENKVEKLKQKAKKLENSINESFQAQDETDSGFEYAILDAHITADEKRLEKVQEQIREKEHEIKVLRGEAEPPRIKPWTKERPSQELKLEAFAVV